MEKFKEYSWLIIAVIFFPLLSALIAAPGAEFSLRDHFTSLFIFFFLGTLCLVLPFIGNRKNSLSLASLTGIVVFALCILLLISPKPEALGAFVLSHVFIFILGFGLGGFGFIYLIFPEEWKKIMRLHKIKAASKKAKA